MASQNQAEVQLYIKEYSTRFNLAQYVRFGHFVLSVTPSATGGWEVTFVSTAANGKRDVRQETESFDKCIIASGIFSEPYYPPTEKVKGVLDAVESGWATHSASYKDPGVYARKSVLVVGCAFSGAEIASGEPSLALRCPLFGLEVEHLCSNVHTSETIAGTSCPILAWHCTNGTRGVRCGWKV